MKTTSSNSKPKGSNNNVNRVGMAVAIAAGSAGAAAVEGVNVLYTQLDDDSDAVVAPIVEAEPENEPTAEHTPDDTSIQESSSIAEESSTHSSEPPVTPVDPPVNPPVESPVPPVEPPVEPPVTPVDPPVEPPVDPVNPPLASNTLEEIIEEIDEKDNEKENVFTAENITVEYTQDGKEQSVAYIRDSIGEPMKMVDVDGDKVYDEVQTLNGEIVDFVSGDIDESDMQLYLAQQRGEEGYLEQNEQDIAMNHETEDIQNDIDLA